MVSSTATTVAAYLASLPADRRATIAAVRDVIRRNLPRGYEETMGYGMISYQIPLARYPTTYNGQPLCVAALAAQKQHAAVYLMSVYGDPALHAWFVDAWAAAGKKLDMGKSCVRFKRVDDLALDVLGEAIAKVPVDAYIRSYEASRPAAKKPAAKKPAAKKPAARKR